MRSRRYFVKTAGVLLAAVLTAASLPANTFAEETVPKSEMLPEGPEEDIPAEEGVSAEEGIPAEEGTLAEEGIPAEEGISAEEGIPVEEGISAEEGIQAEEGISVEEGIQAEESISEEEGIPPQEEMSFTEDDISAEETVLLAADDAADSASDPPVRPSKTEVTKLTAGTKKLTVKWTALPGEADGYQLQYSTAKDFSADAKKLKVTGGTTRTAALTELTSGKRYYVRIRAYKKADGKNIYAKWSGVKSAKLTFNTVKASGSSVQSKNIYVYNPKKSLKNVRVAVWTEDCGQDDLKWYDMKKTSAGSWKAAVDMTILMHEGTAYAHVYAGKDTFVGETVFDSPPMGFPVCSSEEEYIERIAPAVQAACKKYGYLPSVLIAQSCLENGYAIPAYWDNPQISALLRFNNMVGLKSELLNSSWYDKTVWPGKSIVKKTPEEYGGQAVIITDSFRVYDSIEQSFEDYLLFMKYASNYGYGGTPKYGEKVLKMKSPKKLIQKVSSLGYATGSTYPDSVMKIIKKHKLTKYDKI